MRFAGSRRLCRITVLSLRQEIKSLMFHLTFMLSGSPSAFLTAHQEEICMKRTIAVFTLAGALVVTPALLASPETKKTEAQEAKKSETQADLQKEAKIT